MEKTKNAGFWDFCGWDRDVGIWCADIAETDGLFLGMTKRLSHVN
ncbi:hypothetical protein LACPH_001836 [Lacticaseibacillus parahuelsenbergensis]|uniref:Uncharacterized protein n=1 Tax=Lacticaseibacillus parahuelsenbergensis TaxID=3068305 RepID=A0ABY9L006_9LACO|nr:hypothetical protein [Lacticaseibacillus sp. NCIMB 15471]WLV77111.1 hypothetical protein LACPH_001836 [Lacticaseibacillus sp. NCIMB 15471]